jgi:hypothetical protein
VAGLTWGLASRPTKLAAAMEVDRQLGWSDLLGTAWMLRRPGGEAEMERTVIAMAEARCTSTAASAVVLNRLGMRGWGGIGLAGALVLGVSLFGGDPNRAAAARTVAAGPQSWQEIEAMQERGNTARMNASADNRRAKPGLGGDDDDPANSTSTTPDTASGTAANAASNNGVGGAREGTGAGAGQSASRAGGSKPGANAAAGGDVNAKEGTVGATSAGGSGTASESTANGGGQSGSSAGANAVRKAAPVWRGQGWPADQAAAQAAIVGGQVPDAYREMVREYFERE